MKREECFELGYITRPHGIRGEVYVHLDADDPEKYKKLGSVFIEINNDLIPFSVETIRFRGPKTLFAFKECKDLESASALKSRKLFLPLDKLPALEGGQFYYHEVIGYTVVDAEEGALGKVERFYERQGQDLLSMKYRNREVLIPVTGDIIGKADHRLRELYVELPEGLVDIYL